MPRLTLKRLDHLSAVAFANPHAVPSQSFVATELSAYMEWYWLRHSGHSLGSLLRTGPFEEFHVRLRSSAEYWIASRVPPRGFIRVRRDHMDTANLTWVKFRYGMQRAAVAAGFGRTWAKQIVGAIGELEDNVHCHSGAPETGILAYWITGSDLDFVVLDRGDGVLESLRRCGEHRDLMDHGTALTLATQNGMSRYGTAAGRGWGFNDLFVGLANSKADIRFRSGDHLLRVDGRHGLPGSRLHQRAGGTGLLISARVSCVRG